MNKPYEHKPGRGSLFKNDKRETEKQPQYKGSGKDPDGREIWISAWIDETKSGDKFFSMSFQYKDEVDSAGMAQARAAAEPDPLDDGGDLPF